MQPKRTSPRVPGAIDRHVAKRARMQRLRKGLTQPQLCERLGVSLTALQAIEGGRRKWTAYRLLMCAQVLDCDVGHFFRDPPAGYAMPEEPDVGTMENGDTRRLLRAWDQLTGNARKHVLALTIGMARSQRNERRVAELEALAARTEGLLPAA